MVLLLAKQIITLYHAVQKLFAKDQHALKSGLCIGGRETRLAMGYRSLGATLHQVPI